MAFAPSRETGSPDNNVATALTVGRSEPNDRLGISNPVAPRVCSKVALLPPLSDLAPLRPPPIPASSSGDSSSNIAAARRDPPPPSSIASSRTVSLRSHRTDSAVTGLQPGPSSLAQRTKEDLLAKHLPAPVFESPLDVAKEPHFLAGHSAVSSSQNANGRVSQHMEIVPVRP